MGCMIASKCLKMNVNSYLEFLGRKPRTANRLAMIWRVPALSRVTGVVD